MEKEETKLKDCFLLKPRIFKDERGFFLQTYQKDQYKELGIPYEFVQDNQSFSHKGVIRGLHMQRGSFSQGKLVSVPFGKVLDVAVDLRKNSSTFGEWVGFELSHENGFQLYIPRGFAHGFISLSEGTILNYKCDNYYDKDSECSLDLFDKELSINWGISQEEAIISQKDLQGSISFKEFKEKNL